METPHDPNGPRTPSLASARGLGLAARRRRQGRLAALALAVVGLGAALGLTLFALQDQVVFFKSPADIAAEPPAVGERIRIGGLVKEGTLQRDGERASFVVTDTAADVAVTHTGILPDLFREGQGVVIDGALTNSGTFRADTVLAKHDENYIPSEVADALEAQGVWRGDASVVVGE